MTNQVQLVSSRVLSPACQITGHFRDEPFQTINCTGTDNRKQRIRIMHAPKTKKTNAKKLALALKQTYNYKTPVQLPSITSGQDTE